MPFATLQNINEQGFSGFVTISSLFCNSKLIPKARGVYLVLRLSEAAPEFLRIETGCFKNKNPNVSIQELEKNWVVGTPVIYIGKAGGENEATLQSRIRQYLRFGRGKNSGHSGGRLIWLIKDYKDFVVCWKELPAEEPREYEKALIQEFVAEFGQRPFANLRD